MRGIHWQQYEKTDSCSRQKRKRCEFFAHLFFLPNIVFCIMADVTDISLFSLRDNVLSTSRLLLSLPLTAISGGSVPRLSGLHRGEQAPVTDEARETQNF